MFMIVMIVAMLVCLVVAGFYYYILLKRIGSLFTTKLKKTIKITFIVLAVILGISSANLFSTLGVILVHIAVIALLVDFINLIIKKITCEKYSDMRRWRIVYCSLVIPVLMTALIFTYGYFNIRNVIRTDYTVTTEKNIEKDFRVLLITDSHYGTIFQSEKLKELKAEMDTVGADIVILAGDIVDESTSKEQMKEIFKEFGSIQSTYGVYFTYGNHDRQRYSMDSEYTEEELKVAIESAGIHLLHDDVMEVMEGVTIIGREDYGRDGKDRMAIDDLVKQVNSEDYLILADHQPMEYEKNAAAGIDLMVSGHTHAGQIFPAGAIMTLFHTSDQCYGITKEGNMQAVTTAGIAGWGYPIRTERHSEYTVIDVKKK